MDFAKFFLWPAEWEELPLPWPKIFGRTAPLGVEIGFGNGEFLVRMAQIQGDWNWVGFETSLTCGVKTGKKLARERLPNVRLIILEGKFGLRELFADGSVERIYVNFPCPWPKSRHAHRRLVDEEFARILAAILAHSGEFHLVTDVRWYAEEAREQLARAGLVEEGPEPLEKGPQTRYERKWRSQGFSVWGVLAKAQKPGKVERISEGSMPHAKISVPFSAPKVTALAGLKETWPGGAFIVKDVLLSSTTKSAVLRVFASDQGFSQHFFLAVAEHKDGVIVQLDSASVPFRTPAVKRAVTAVAQALETSCSSF